MNDSTAVQNEVNAALDPAEWERPGPDGSPSGGFKITWLAPQGLETYDQYVARLRAAGWLGLATPATLGEDNGDPEYGASGVPCTSVASGSTIGADVPATIYQNAPTLGQGDPDPAAPSCLGGLETSRFSNVCGFRNVPWAVQTNGNETFYENACANAWGDFWFRQTVFDEDGNILDLSQVHDMSYGSEFGDADLIAKLKAIDSDMDHWVKARTDSYSDTYPYEIHFYYNTVTNIARFDIDFKLRFTEVFGP